VGAGPAELVCNLAYTFSITRIAHYIKSIMRDNIGSQADAAYIQAALTGWISNYVTTVVNTDDITLRRYPFKAAAVSVEPRPGRLGWYKCTASVLPHIQFEGMDVELRLESRLG
jgi:type VI secretion system protein ImpC